MRLRLLTLRLFPFSLDLSGQELAFEKVFYFLLFTAEGRPQATAPSDEKLLYVNSALCVFLFVYLHGCVYPC